MDSAQAEPSVAKKPAPTVVGPAMLRKDVLYDQLVQAQSDLGEGVVIGDVATILYANDALARMSGYDASELMAPDFDARRLWAPEMRERLEERLAAVASSDPAPAHYEAVFLRRDGSRMPAEVVSKPVEVNGRLYRIALIRDLSERRRREQELAAAQARVATSEKLAALGSLVSGVAHEVRTPLTSVLNHLNLVRANVARAAGVGETDRRALTAHVEASVDGIERILRIVEDLRRYAQPGGQTLVKVSLDQVAESTLRLYTLAQPEAARFEPLLAPTPLVQADRVQLQQAILHLVSNAVEADPGGAVRIETRPGPGGGAEILVHDHGPGIAADVQARMYEPFFTTKPGSMGLGLSIVRRIAEAHGGGVRCDSRLGVGTTFQLSLPAAPRAAAHGP